MIEMLLAKLSEWIITNYGIKAVFNTDLESAANIMRIAPKIMMGDKSSNPSDPIFEIYIKIRAKQLTEE
jgi:hypothetical protein